MGSALVTGGAGFIGSHLVDALLERGHRVTILDDLSTGRWENLAGALNRGARFHPGGVTDAAAVARVFAAAQPDTVFHLAAQIDVRHAVADPARDATVNLIGTVTMLEAARRHGVRRFVLASTGGAIYGDALQVPTPETATPRPGSPYAASKAAAESYLELYRQLHGLSTFTLRLANVYGPRQAGGEAGVIAIFCAAATLGDAVTIYGDGAQTRDFVYVGDVVEAFLTASERDDAGCCNIATGRETSVLELARALELRVRFASARAGEVQRSCLDPSAAAQRLGWRAGTPLTAGLERTLTSMAPAEHRARAAFASP
jgi:UDP-glucose 4-epimerase